MAIQLGFQPADFSWKTARAVAAEFIATGLFVFLGTATVVSASAVYTGQLFTSSPIPWFDVVIPVALAHGLAIMLLVAATARISGGHLNPAVTFAAAATGKMKVSTAVLYVLAQLGAAILAVLLLKGIIAGPMEGTLGTHSLFVYVPNESFGLLDDAWANGAAGGLAVEAVLTFMLVFVVFATAFDRKGMKEWAPAAIGLAYLVGQLVAMPLTGGSMNPARTFGPAVVENFWSDHWLYWFGPFIGAALAALVYEFVFLEGDDEEPAGPFEEMEEVEPEAPAAPGAAEA